MIIHGQSVYNHSVVMEVSSNLTVISVITLVVTVYYSVCKIRNWVKDTWDLPVFTTACESTLLSK